MMKIKILAVTCMLCALAVLTTGVVGEVINVNVASVQYTNFEVELETSGEIVPKDTYTLTNSTAGQVLNIEVSEGEHVKENNVIMNIAPQIDADAVFATNTYSTVEKIQKAQTSSLSITDFEAADIQDVQASTPYSSATQLKSPFDGEIVSINCKVGEEIPSGTDIAVIASPEKIVSGSVEQKDIDRVEVGQNCRIKIEGYDIEFQGKVTDIAHIAQTDETGKETISVDILPTIAIDALTGSDVEVKITTEKAYGALYISTNCLYTQNSVYVVNERGKAEIREIETGIISGDYMQITSGLRLNEIIVVNPENTLKSGHTVVAVSED